jgi:hypothetical protein
MIIPIDRGRRKEAERLIDDVAARMTAHIREGIKNPPGNCALGYGEECTPAMHVCCDCEVMGLRR